MRDLSIVYKWAEFEAIDIEERFSSFRGFSTPELTSIAQKLCTTKSGPASRSTCQRRLEAFRDYIKFSYDYNIENAKLSLIEQAQAEKNRDNQLKKLTKRMTRHSNLSPEPRCSTDLTKSEVDVILAAIDPGSPSNCFKEERVKVRNFALIALALETFARRSELVLLETTDLDLGYEPTVTIKKPTTVNQLKRRDGASMKTRGRIIPISLELASVLRFYLDHVRDEFLIPKRPTTSLFLSSRDGRRIAAMSLNHILKKVSQIPEIKQLGVRIHPHGLRSTGATEIRRKIDANGVSSGIMMEEVLSYLGGWVSGSPMVRRYTKTALSEKLGAMVRGKKAVLERLTP
ncbi:site-specific integrase [Pseudomonas sp. SID14000]|uniref:tyrosine-type recombinase/integrase n=1 Tax=Pseudomonas sp. SID14000 TaxID=1986221 RepID=UPI00148313F4|nr:site-specific integrase [Pseudomonas sp. SID14000]